MYAFAGVTRVRVWQLVWLGLIWVGLVIGAGGNLVMDPWGLSMPWSDPNAGVGGIKALEIRNSKGNRNHHTYFSRNPEQDI